MKVKQLIEKYENILKKSVPFTVVNIHGVLKDLRQLDEPQRATIPQLIADWIEQCKNNFGFNLKSAMNINTILHYSDDGHKVIDWIKVNSNQEAFVRAWLDGYEVEKEKRYCISMPKARNYKNHAQILCEKDGKIFWCGEWYPFRTKFTRKQLEEADFGWVFDCEGVEIEEVEE